MARKSNTKKAETAAAVTEAPVEAAAESVVLTTSPAEEDAVDVVEELLPQPAIPAVITAARPIAISLFVFM